MEPKREAELKRALQLARGDAERAGNLGLASALRAAEADGADPRREPTWHHAAAGLLPHPLDHYRGR
ncbi:MAG: hypothetical protein H6816_15665 [Phycisphaerales bacterium]|nr:hypothetical protein [Phycisphaerales bacterium]